MSEMNQLKMFTVEEANALIPKLTEILKFLQVKREKILSQEVEIDALELVTDLKNAAQTKTLNDAVEDYQRIVAEFYAAVDEVHSMGCLLKDLDLGLIDFYSLYHNRIVYLCWKLGDAEVGHWHEIGRGYSHRQPLIFDGD